MGLDNVLHVLELVEHLLANDVDVMEAVAMDSDFVWVEYEVSQRVPTEIVGLLNDGRVDDTELDDPAFSFFLDD